MLRQLWLKYKTRKALSLEELQALMVLLVEKPEVVFGEGVNQGNEQRFEPSDQSLFNNNPEGSSYEYRRVCIPALREGSSSVTEGYLYIDNELGFEIRADYKNGGLDVISLTRCHDSAKLAGLVINVGGSRPVVYQDSPAMREALKPSLGSWGAFHGPIENRMRAYLTNQLPLFLVMRALSLDE